MSAPSWEHQEISAALTSLFWTFLRGKKCRVVAAPFDIRINYDTSDNTVVQPDLVVICDSKKIENGKHCLGAPDLAIEILSGSTHSYDKLKKYNVYLEAGVREYWIIDPYERFVETYVLKDGQYLSAVYGDTGVIPVSVLEDCSIDLSAVFEPVEEEPEDAQQEE